MKIFIDIGHPAHVHYFRNFIAIMQRKGHEFFITARDKEVSLTLLKKYKIPFLNRGKGFNNLFGKAAYLLKADYVLFRESIKFKPDLFLSFASPYAAHVAKVLNKPHISFTDTENARLGILSFAPFTDCILTPKCFSKEFNYKHIRFDGFMELCYLHPKIFSPDESVLREVNLKKDEPFAIIRFISWGANHDIGQSGIPDSSKIELVSELSKRLKVFISSEGDIPVEIQKYKIAISPEKLLHLMSYASIYVGEGATMASESAVLGIPTVYINSLSTCYLEEEATYGLVYNFRNYKGVLNKVLDLIKNRQSLKAESQRMLNDQIDVTSFMVWFVENYPQSHVIMKEKPEFQNNFR